MVKFNWDSFRWEKLRAFNMLADYLRVVHRQLEEAASLQHFNIELEFQNRSFETEEHFQEASSIYSAECEFVRQQFATEFPRTLFYGMIVQCFLVLEASATDVCNEIAKRRNIKITIRDLKGSLLDRIKCFQSKVAGLPVNSRNTWLGVADLQKLRDCIVHNLGNIAESRDQKRIAEIVRDHIYLGVASTEEGQLDIGIEGCAQMLTTSQRFVDELCESGGFGPSQLTVVS